VILRSEPSSRAALMGEQPNPWDLSLPPLLVGQDYTFTMPISCRHERFRCEPCDRPRTEDTISPDVLRGCTHGSVVTGGDFLDHCRRILTPSSRSDIQKRQCICQLSHVCEIISGVNLPNNHDPLELGQCRTLRAATTRHIDAVELP